MKRTAIILAAALVLAACAPKETSSTSMTGASAAGSQIQGAGATFPYPLYSKWFDEYGRNHAAVKINYQSIGSGGGIRQFSEMVVNFGATDGPMTDEQMARAKGGPVLHVPTAMGAVAITYNLPRITKPVRLDGALLADIYRGVVTRWNDPRLAALNPGLALPASDILVVHRADGSGTTYAFTDFLSAVNPAWAAGPGKGTDVKWPVGLGGKGSEGVTGQVKQLEGAIGYVELSYARQNHLPTALVKNARGEFVGPSSAAVTSAASGVLATLPANTDYRISIVNAPGKGAYPISSLTWVLLYRAQKDAETGKPLVDFLKWGLTEGQRYETALDYAPLPPAMAKRLLQQLKKVTIASR